MEHARETGGCTELVYSSGKSVFIFVNGNDLPPDIWQGTQKFRAFARRHNNNKHRVHRAPAETRTERERARARVRIGRV